MMFTTLFSSPAVVLALVTAVLFLLFTLPPLWTERYHRKKSGAASAPWWELLLNHPGRLLFSTFFLLCLGGSLALLLPWATTRSVPGIDAVFTAVSAVCVTGLATLDTPKDFTFAGQLTLLLLIQLGGLGIMSITTAALASLGHRLSLRHEKVMASATDTSRSQLLSALRIILLYTAVVELTGALLLSLLFAWHHVPDPIWRGLFTAVSACCNAGFALQSDSLVPFQHLPLILHTIALLIICGSIAPATALLIPAWLRGRPIPLTARLPLAMTAVLLLGGFVALLALEWNGILAGLPLLDKLHNAWFQSVTLRTAGFNSVPLAPITAPTLLIMLLLMFIGGSPGGTAGGVKTTTFGLLALTFATNITGRREILFHHRAIATAAIFRAVTVTIAGGLVCFATLFMLETTQLISSRKLIFEAVSAVATVGLTIGATPLLDEPGKLIIILAMFVGRIGPLTLFMLLGSESDDDTVSRHPTENVTSG